MLFEKPHLLWWGQDLIASALDRSHSSLGLNEGDFSLNKKRVFDTDMIHNDDAIGDAVLFGQSNQFTAWSIVAVQLAQKQGPKTRHTGETLQSRNTAIVYILDCPTAFFPSYLEHHHLFVHLWGPGGMQAVRGSSADLQGQPSKL